MVVAGLDAFETGRLAGTDRAQPLQGDAFRLLQHALVPDSQGQFAPLLQMGKFPVCPVPEEPLQESVRPLVSRAAPHLPGHWQGLPMGDGRPRQEPMAVQIPVGEVEQRSLDVYELAAVGGAR